MYHESRPQINIVCESPKYVYQVICLLYTHKHEVRGPFLYIVVNNLSYYILTIIIQRHRNGHRQQIGQNIGHNMSTLNYQSLQLLKTSWSEFLNYEYATSLSRSLIQCKTILSKCFEA